MFVCCTKWSSVVNLDLFQKQVFSYMTLLYLVYFLTFLAGMGIKPGIFSISFTFIFTLLLSHRDSHLPLCSQWRHDIQHNDTQLKGLWQNGTQHNNTLNRVPLCSLIMLSVDMLNAVILSAIMLNVMAPFTVYNSFQS